MPGFKQSSIPFALRSLESLEHEWKAEHAEHERLLSHVDAARTARERRKREEAERLREEDARIEAMKQAEVARALAEAEARARFEVSAQERQHQQRLTEIDAEARSRRQKALGWLGMLVAVVAIAGALGVYLFKVRPETERIQSAYDRLVLAERTRADDVRAAALPRAGAPQEPRAETRAGRSGDRGAEEEADRLSRRALNRSRGLGVQLEDARLPPSAPSVITHGYCFTIFRFPQYLPASHRRPTGAGC